METTIPPGVILIYFGGDKIRDNPQNDTNHGLSSFVMIFIVFSLLLTLFTWMLKKWRQVLFVFVLKFKIGSLNKIIFKEQWVHLEPKTDLSWKSLSWYHNDQNIVIWPLCFRFVLDWNFKIFILHNSRFPCND